MIPEEAIQPRRNVIRELGVHSECQGEVRDAYIDWPNGSCG